MLYLIIGSLVLGALLLVTTVGWKRDPDERVRQRVAQLRERILQAEGKSLSTGEPVWSPTGQRVSVTWDFDVRSDWHAYSLWLAERLKSDFRVQDASEEEIEFFQYAPGDVYHLLIRVMWKGTPLRLKATFTTPP
jgi:hypothetical protein